MAVQGHGVRERRRGMNILVRGDASTDIGTGHVMRCLTLADALTAAGHAVRFITRLHPGHLADAIRGRGYSVDELPARNEPDLTGYARWLGTTEAQDADDCVALIDEYRPDWLVVDHYALGRAWEDRFRSETIRILAMDDLAERPHSCDLLLDQTWGRAAADYQSLIPAGCQALCGSDYALLRPEFAARRDHSLRRRREGAVRSILVTMGGVDKDNATGQILSALTQATLAPGTELTVVMGASAPWRDAVAAAAKAMPWPTQVVSGVSDMADRMANADLAIGAAGATSWERCCLGLPSVMVVLAENQRTVATNLEKAGAALLIDEPAKIKTHLPELVGALAANPERVKQMAGQAAAIVDGRGVERVVAAIATMTEGKRVF
ncbi:UDP-2,4-diacetamido-2,4,6-trideoxy-beta-L-altropyranose hydrolase [Marinobacter gudaonensis]|uniref:UDP-2,4-diacetamido-2,4,6-trideoxy-beta-L-altropyranose hydrolase n=1 Tax=Marinobacter gudaonensis TaxID=375760 RepID=A0A1I6GJ71_9GAMM|nr:UDP-2,4-diacetamido-2,4,6-trideoxy-beta-L-altropyranose hydrolase [Marinobacter gudaonensis]SFR42245.1 UDP-2,4-diacetamido-2,4,6-trideoxy-beta-L-altropyranose hydrolase [Marinobacter gudaonensis]